MSVPRKLAFAATGLIAIAVTWSVFVRAVGPAASMAKPQAGAPAAAPSSTAQNITQPARSVQSENPVAVGEMRARQPASDAVASEPARVLVVDMDGQPIAGARVAREKPPRSPEWTGETNAMGQCSLAAPGENKFWFVVKAAGYVGSRSFHSREGEVRVELAAALELPGRVLDKEAHEPISGATVRASALRGHMDGAVVKSGADGRFLLQDAPTIKHVGIIATAPGYAQSNTTWDFVDVAAGAEIELFLVRQATIGFQFLDDTGVPLAGFDAGSEETDATGRVSLSLEPGAVSDGVVNFGLDGPDFYRVGIMIDEAADSPIEVRLPRPARIEGFVRDVRGRAVAKALVSFTPAIPAEPQFGWAFEIPHGRAYVHWTPPMARTDERGWYRSSPLAPSVGPFLVKVTNVNSSDPEDVVQNVVVGSTTRLDLALRGLDQGGEGTIRGRVFMNGEPTTGTVVWQAGEATGRCKTAGRPWSPPGTADKGVYEGAVPAGEVELSLELDDHRLWRVESYVAGATARVQVEEGQTAEYDFELELPMADVAGRVVDAHGEPVPKLPVVVADTDQRFYQQTHTDFDGHWLISVPDQGWEYYVRSRYGGVDLLQRGVMAGDLHVDLRLPGLGVLPVRVLDAETDAVVQEWELSYQVRGEQERLCGRRLSIGQNAARPDGWVPLELRIGVLDLLFHSPEFGYQRASVQGVVVGSGDNEGIEVRLQPGFEQDFALAEGCDDPDERQVQILLLEEDLWASVHHGAEIKVGEPTVRFGADHLVYGHGPHYSGATLETRMLNFDGGRATLRSLAPGRWRFKAPASIAVEPEYVLMPHEGPVEIRWWSTN